MAYYALVPAAGSGSRMGGAQPKQYLPLGGRPLIHHALVTLCNAPQVSAVFVVLSGDDREWDRYDWSRFDAKLRVLRCGGETRAQSVRNGLDAMADELAATDWVLVHDAARACLAASHVQDLIREVGDDPVGGILAVPVADTLKRAYGTQRIAATVARDGLWQAQTPQMFRHGQLRQALREAAHVTDEAGAIESVGLSPKLVPCDATNLKVTYPVDLQLAELILASRRTA